MLDLGTFATTPSLFWFFETGSPCVFRLAVNSQFLAQAGPKFGVILCLSLPRNEIIGVPCYIFSLSQFSVHRLGNPLVFLFVCFGTRD